MQRRRRRDEKLVHAADDKRRDVRVVHEPCSCVLRRHGLPEARHARKNVGRRRTIPSIGRAARENGPRRRGARSDAAGDAGGRKAAQLRREGGVVNGGLARKHPDERVVGRLRHGRITRRAAGHIDEFDVRRVAPIERIDRVENRDVHQRQTAREKHRWLERPWRAQRRHQDSIPLQHRVRALRKSALRQTHAHHQMNADTHRLGI